MQLGNILFQVHPFNPDFSLPLTGVNDQAALQCQGQVVLRNLVAFHQVRVGVVLAVELGVFRDAAAQGEPCHHGVFHGLLVDHGKCAWEPQAHRTHPLVRRGRLVVGPAGTKHFALGLELDVDFQTYNSFVFHLRIPIIHGAGVFTNTLFGLSIAGAGAQRPSRQPWSAPWSQYAKAREL